MRSIRAAFDVMGVESARSAADLPQRRAARTWSRIVGGCGRFRADDRLGAGPRCVEWDQAAVLRLANEIEGHPDNVAACIYGGFTIAWGSGDEVGATRLDVHEASAHTCSSLRLRCRHISARALLPETVPHRDAAFNAGRAGLLVAAMTQHPESAVRSHRGSAASAAIASLRCPRRSQLVARSAFDRRRRLRIRRRSRPCSP